MNHRSGAGPLCIGLLLPDVLGTYSDRGNALVLAQRARWRGIPVELVEAPAGSTPPASCDIYVLGGGEDAAQLYAAEWLTRHRQLRHALTRAQVVAVCAGLQLLGGWTADLEGRRHAGADLLDLTTYPGRRRAVGEAVVDGHARGVGAVTGFENHRGRTVRGEHLPPLGRTLSGTGNGDGTDGVFTATVVGTYLHGPVLARNPALADLVLRRATGCAGLLPLEVADEQAARCLHLRDARHGVQRLAGPVRRALRRPARAT
jgi:lipid II isoglutaminyl synthase (glutamine-hydrolysing)